MKKILYISALITCVSLMVTLWSFKPAKGSLVAIEVEKINQKDDDQSEPWLVKTSKASIDNFNNWRSLKLSNTTLTKSPAPGVKTTWKDEARPTVFLAKTNETYVQVYQNTFDKPVESIIDPHNTQAALDPKTADNDWPAITHSVLAIQDDGTALIMNKDELAKKRQEAKQL